MIKDGQVRKLRSLLASGASLAVDSQRRTFERRVREWRGSRGPNSEVMFAQVHHPGDLAASDFTNMNSLRITIVAVRAPAVPLDPDVFELGVGRDLLFGIIRSFQPWLPKAMWRSVASLVASFRREYGC